MKKRLTILILVLITPFFLHAQILINEDFATGTLPAGWSNTAIQASKTWSFQNSPILSSPSAGYYAVFNDTQATTTNEAILQIPSFNCVGRTDVKLSFHHFWDDVEQTHGYVEISTDGGTTWTELMNDGVGDIGSLIIPEEEIIDITAIVSGQTDVRIRFRFANEGSNGGKNWYIDDVRVYSEPDVGIVSMSVPDYLTCAAPYSNTETVTIEIFNFGVDTVENVPVKVDIIGGITTTLSGTYVPEIPPQTSAFYTFSSTIDMSADDQYGFDAYTEMVGDQFLGNNNFITSRRQWATNYAHTEDFNLTSEGWKAINPNSNNYWVWGEIPYLSGEEGNGKSWYIVRDGTSTYHDFVIESPVFDLSSMTNPVLNFDLKYSFGDDPYDRYFRLEYTIDNGASWHRLGSNADPGWYNPGGDASYDQGWASGTVDEWTNYQHSLCNIVGESCVKFRFWGEDTRYSDRFAFDNFIVEDKPDVGVIAQLAPLDAGCLFSDQQEVTIRVYNWSCTPISNVPVKCDITGAITQTLTGTVPGPILSGGSVDYTFSTTFDMTGIGLYTFTNTTQLVGDGNTTNDALVRDINVTLDKINSFPYTEDFDADDGGWLMSGGSGTNYWEWGILSYLNGPEGNGNCWYMVRDGSSTYTVMYLNSPVFDFSENTKPILSFDIKYALGDDPYDRYVRIDYSLDGGGTWTRLGSNGDPNWYNPGGDAAYDQGWASGTVDTWTHVEHDLCYLSGENCVKFRLTAIDTRYSDKFAIDNIEVDEGTADDIEVLELYPTDAGHCSGFTEMETVGLLIQNNTCRPLTNIPVQFDMTGAGTATYQDTIPGPINRFDRYYYKLREYESEDFGTALDFDGSNDRVQTTALPALGTDYTIEFWVKRNGGDATYDRMTSIPGDLFETAKSNDGSVRFYHGSWRDTGFNLGTGTWTHIAFTADGSTFRFYVNGVLRYSVAGTRSITAQQWYLGGHYGGTACTNISMDNLVIWDDARTNAEVRDDMFASLTGAEADLVAFYDMEDGTGSTTLTDRKSGAYNGTLLNMDPATDWSSIGTISRALDYTVDMSAAGTYNLQFITGDNPTGTGWSLINDDVPANNTHAQNRYNSVINTYPHVSTFDASNEGWASYPLSNLRRYWHNDDVPYLAGPSGNGSSWYIESNGSSNYDRIWVESPVYDLSGLTNPMVSFDIMYSMADDPYDRYVRFEYSLDGGTTWTRLGDNSDPEWYNPGGDATYDVGWASSTYSNWTNVQHSLCGLIGESCVKFRFYAFDVRYSDRFAFDNFKVIDDTDVAVLSYVDPVDLGCLFGQYQSVTVEVYNFSCNPVSNIPIECDITGPTTTTLTGTVAGPINPGSSVLYTFTNTFNMISTGTYDFETTVTLPDYNPSNDALTTSIDVNQLKVATYPYDEDFNADDGLWYPSGGNAANYWLYGNLPYLNGDEGEGDCWYMVRDGSSTYVQMFLTSPVFDFTQNTNPVLSFDIKYALGDDPYDRYVRVDYSTDGGTSWTRLGSNSDPDWYNPGGDASYDQGWASGTVDAWTNVTHDMCFLSGYECVKLRITAIDTRYSDKFAIDNVIVSAGNGDDLETIRIYGPDGGTCSSYSNAETIGVLIQNNGCRPLTNVPVQLDVTGANTTTINEVIPGPVPRFGRYYYTFAQTVDMTNPGTYNFDVTTSSNLSGTGQSYIDDQTPANDSHHEVRYNSKIAGIPYFADFEADNQGWASGPLSNTRRYFENDVFTSLNGDEGNGKAWYIVSDGSSTYDRIWLQSPVFDFSTTASPMLSFETKYTLADDPYDRYVRVDFSTDGGANWTRLGSNADPDWYNPGGDASYDQGWASGTKDEWTYVQHSLCNLVGEPCVQFRIYAHDIRYNDNFVIDNFYIREMVDVGVSAHVAPVYDGCLHSDETYVTATVYNWSCSPVVDIPIVCDITGANTVTLNDIVPGPIPANGSVNFTISTAFDMLTVGNYQFSTYTDVPTEPNRENDTTHYNVNVNHLEVDTYPSTEDFNANSGFGNWRTGGGNATNYWQWGSVPYLEGAAGNGNSWYMVRDGSSTYSAMWLESPVYDFSGVQNPTLSFDMMYQFGDDPYDRYARIEYSLDGGGSWTRLGSNADPNWYNPGGDASYDQGWASSTQSTWKNYRHSVCAAARRSCVMFRVYIHDSRYSDKFAFDNFRITDTPLDAEIMAAAGCWGSEYDLAVDVYNRDDFCQLWEECSFDAQTALEFDGSNDKVSLGTFPAMGTDFTIEYWIKRNGGDGTYDRITSISGDLFETVKSNDGSIRFYHGSWRDTGYDLPMGVWTHVAFVANGTSIKVYANGIQIYSINAARNITAADWYLGGRYTNTEFTNISLDEVRIWDIAKTPDELINNMCQPLVGNEASLVAYYQMEDGTGSSTLTDVTGNGHTGTLQNMDPATDWVSSDLLSNNGQKPAAIPTITSLDLSYSIDGGATVTGTYATNIVPGDIETVVIPGLTIPSDTSIVKIWVSYPNAITDQIYENDTIYIDFANWPECNDHCSNATEILTQVTYASQTSNATDNPLEDPAFSCMSSGPDGIPGNGDDVPVTVENSVWYWFTTDCDGGEIEVSFTNIGGPACSNGIQVSIDKLNTLPECDPLNYTNVFCDFPNTTDDIVWSGTVGADEVYYITVDGVANGQCGFEILVDGAVAFDPANALSGTYQIAPSNALYPDFTAAFDSLETYGIAGDVTFEVQDTVYNEQLVLHGICKQDPADIVTFKSVCDNCNKPKVEFDASDYYVACGENFGNTLNFDGSNDYVQIMYNEPENEMTHEFWFKTTNPNGGLFMVGSGSMGGGGNDRHIYLNNGNITTRVWNNEVIATSGTNYADGTWHHLVHTFGSSIGEQRIYVDGVLQATGTKSSSDFNWEDRIIIGYSADKGYFQGEIDEVRIWNKVLTETEINNQMCNLLSGSEADLLAYYQFEDGEGSTTLTDVSGNGRDATLVNMGAGNDWDISDIAFDNDFQNALDFDGTDDFVRIPDSPVHDFSAGDFTVEAWIYPYANGGTGQRIVNNRGTGSGGSYKGFQLKIDATATAWRINDASIDDASGNYRACANCGNQYTVDNWHHIAMVYSSALNTLNFYVNGTLDGTVSVPVGYGDIDNNLPLAIGAAISANGSEGTYSQFFEGKIDEVKIWNVARTQTQLSNDMLTVPTGSEAGLVAYYNFENGSGTTLSDLTATANDGVLTNMDAGIDWVASGVSPNSIIPAVSASYDNYVMTLDNAKNYRFERIEFEALDPEKSRVVILNEVDDITFDQCDFVATENPTITANDQVLIFSNELDGSTNLSFTNSSFIGGSDAINLTSTGTAIYQPQVLNSTFTNNLRSGIIINNSNTPQISGNTLVTNSSEDGFSGISLTDVITSLQIQNNQIYATSADGTGIYLNNAIAAGGTEGTIANNMISLGADAAGYGINLENNTAFQNVYFNSINQTSNTGTALRLNTTDNIVLQNNIFASANTSTDITANTNLTEDYNNFFPDYVAKGANSISGNPNYLANNDIHTENGAMKAGTPTAGFTLDIDGETRDALMPFMGADEYLGLVSWTGLVNTDWNNPGNWSSNQVPTLGTSVKIPVTVPNFPETNSKADLLAECKNMTIDAGSHVWIEPAKYLTIHNNFNQNGDLVLQSGTAGNASLITNGAVSYGAGTTQSDLYLTGSNWHYITSPITNANAMLFNFTPEFYWYDESTADAWLGDNFSGTMGWTLYPSGVMPTGLGYAYRDLNATRNVSFVGQHNNGDQTINLTFTDNFSTPDSAVFNGWNLVGNPYPSSLNWNDESISKTNIDNAIYVYDDDGSASYNNYRYYVAGTPNSPYPSIALNQGTCYIPPMQAFYVRANATGASVQMSNTARAHSDAEFFKNLKVDETDRIILELEKEGVTDQAAVRFIPVATEGYDGEFDAFKLYSTSAQVPQIYFTKENQMHMAVNTLSGIYDGLTVPVGVKAGTAGEYHITIPELNLKDGVSAYFEDLELGTITEITNDFSYSIYLESGHVQGRFQIVFSLGKSVSAQRENLGVNIYSHTNNVYLQVEPDYIGSFVEIYNFVGQKIYQDYLISTNTQIPMQAVSGNYLVKLTNGKTVITKTVFVTDFK